MPDWMAAADLVVGKPGGLTSSEALAAGRPFVVVDPYPLQEVANARYLVSVGAGVRAADPSAGAGLALDLIQDDRRRAAMAAAARAAGRPAAAAALVDDLVTEVWRPWPPAAPVAA
jgi:processive 1,2-diacylglycerol beta-glucosyltransferase